MKYKVEVIHVYEIEAENEDDAIDKAIERPYSEAKDCYFNVEEEDN